MSLVILLDNDGSRFSNFLRAKFFKLGILDTHATTTKNDEFFPLSFIFVTSGSHDLSFETLWSQERMTFAALLLVGFLHCFLRTIQFLHHGVSFVAV